MRRWSEVSGVKRRNFETVFSGDVAYRLETVSGARLRIEISVSYGPPFVVALYNRRVSINARGFNNCSYAGQVVRVAVTRQRVPANSVRIF